MRNNNSICADSPQRPWPKSGGTPPQKPDSVSAEAMLLQMDLAGVDRAFIGPPSWEGDRNDMINSI